MVSLDEAVLARYEYGGKRYEILVNPDLVDAFKQDHNSVDMDDFLATDEVWHDAKGGDRPTEEAIESTFGTQEINEIAKIILDKGSIQLTTAQPLPKRNGRTKATDDNSGNSFDSYRSQSENAASKNKD